MVEDYYEILQVHEKAELEIIQAAYRRLARKYHPDIYKGPDGEVRMTKINIAYQVLSDENKRAEYDRQRGQDEQSRQNNNYNNAEESGEYHYRVNHREHSYRKDISSTQQTTTIQKFPVIHFCTRTDQTLDPIDPANIFPPDIKTILCCLKWQDNLPVGTHIKVVWYCDEKIIYRHNFELDANYNKLMTGLEYKAFFNSSIAGTGWEVYITKDGQKAGKGKFKIMSKAEYRQLQFLEGKIGSPNPGLLESLLEFLDNLRRCLQW